MVGRNEEATLRVALGFALDAAEPGDRVWFVDSASIDAEPSVDALSTNHTRSPGSAASSANASATRSVASSLRPTTANVNPAPMREDRTASARPQPLGVS